MKKKTIAVLFGGCSSEYGISLNSGYAVLANMDREKYQPIAIGITKDGRWLRYDGDLKKSALTCGTRMNPNALLHIYCLTAIFTE